MRCNLLTAILLAVVFVSALSPGLIAGQLTLVSNPPGTAVFLDGEYRLSGVTPVTFNQELYGVYQLTAERGGYEKFETKLVIAGDQSRTFEIEMVPKSRFKAAYRSLILPGWGQYYNGQKTRGIMYTSAATISLIATLVANEDFKDKRDLRNDRLSDYYRIRNERTQDPEAIEEAQRRFYEAQDDAYDAETIRRIAFGATAIVWAISVIDAAAFTPERSYTVGGGAVSLDTGDDFDKIGLKLAFEF